MLRINNSRDVLVEALEWEKMVVDCQECRALTKFVAVMSF